MVDLASVPTTDMPGVHAVAPRAQTVQGYPSASSSRETRLTNEVFSALSIIPENRDYTHMLIEPGGEREPPLPVLSSAGL